MPSILITGDPAQHNCSPILVSTVNDNYVFVHPSQVENGRFDPVTFVSAALARATADLIPMPMELMSADITNLAGGRRRVDMTFVEKHAGKRIAAVAP